MSKYILVETDRKDCIGCVLYRPTEPTSASFSCVALICH